MISKQTTVFTSLVHFLFSKEELNANNLEK